MLKIYLLLYPIRISWKICILLSCILQSLLSSQQIRCMAKGFLTGYRTMGKNFYSTHNHQKSHQHHHHRSGLLYYCFLSLYKRWKLKIAGAWNLWNYIGDVRLMITHNFRLGFFLLHTSHLSVTKVLLNLVKVIEVETTPMWLH